MSAWTEGAMKLELHLANSRIKELEAQVENLEARGIHTCHDQCGRPLCVAHRRIRELEAALEYFGINSNKGAFVPLSDVMPLVQWMLNHSPACDSESLSAFLTKHPEAKPQ